MFSMWSDTLCFLVSLVLKWHIYKHLHIKPRQVTLSLFSCHHCPTPLELWQGATPGAGQRLEERITEKRTQASHQKKNLVTKQKKEEKSLLPWYNFQFLLIEPKFPISPTMTAQWLWNSETKKTNLPQSYFNNEVMLNPYLERPLK